MSKKEISIDKLEKQYIVFKPAFLDIEIQLKEKINSVINTESVKLGFPIQSRIKTWDSIVGKHQRGEIKIKHLLDIQDVLGIRIVPLFLSDVERICEILKSELNISRIYNTKEKLETDRFGYASFHLIHKIDYELKGVEKKISIEIQVRTLAQHTWAEFSHVLQYKNEENIPRPLVRAVSRLSAVLEIVDLEYERVINIKQEYRKGLKSTNEEITLNVDIIAQILDSKLPENNKKSIENYDDLLKDLNEFKVKSNTELENLLSTHLEKVKSMDKRKGGKKGFYYSHTGLVRKALELEFGEPWINYITED